MELKKIMTPVGELLWVYHSGEGKEDLSGRWQYVATLALEGEAAEDLKMQINNFWAENKPKKHNKPPKSLGFKPETDADGNETGRTLFIFKTSTTFPNGEKKVINIYNAKGNKIALGDKKIGNGSTGRISGYMGIYESPGGVGVTLYLNSIQLKKFIEYNIGDNFDDISESEEDFITPDENTLPEI